MHGDGCVPLLVAGAGVAGAVAALRAARTGLHVLLLYDDGGARRRPELGESLAAEAVAELHDLGLDDAVERSGQPCRAHRSVWGDGRLHTREQLFDPAGEGRHVSRHRLERLILEAAADAGAVVVPGRVRSAHVDDGCVVLDAGGRRLRARRVIDATGRAAAVCRRLGARRVAHDRSVAVSVSLAGTGVDPSALVEAVPDGWWYTAPTATGLAAVHVTDADLLDRRAVRAPDGWTALLVDAPHTRDRVLSADLSRPERVHLVPAATTLLDPIGRHGVLAVGDAARTEDPLGSGGLLHAITSARAAADAVATGPDGPPHPPDDPTTAYAWRERAEHDEHLEHRRRHYRSERRWPEAPFWRRRAGAPVVACGRRAG